MSMPVEKPRRYSIDEYLQMERGGAERHDYIDGEIVNMSGGTYRHSLIIANAGGELRQRLKGKTCRVLESNLRVGIPRTPRFMYPDIPVICGKPEFDARDTWQETVINPRLVVEVLSPSTERNDRGEKFTRYRKLESLQEYVMVSQDRPEVEVYFRGEEGRWVLSPYFGLESIARLQSLEIDLPLAEIYAGVEFPPGESDESSGAI
jgi:Uma2 family endonuclease